jgi:hypothetical protein
MTKKRNDEVVAKGVYWKKRIAEWERSGHPSGYFVASGFWRWRHFSGGERSCGVRKREAATPFLPLALSGAAPVAVIDVELRSKTRVRLEGEAALRALEAVVARIR